MHSRCGCLDSGSVRRPAGRPTESSRDLNTKISPVQVPKYDQHTQCSPSAAFDMIASGSSNSAESLCHSFCSANSAAFNPSLSTSFPATTPFASFVKVFAKRVEKRSTGPWPKRIFTRPAGGRGKEMWGALRIEARESCKNEASIWEVVVIDIVLVGAAGNIREIWVGFVRRRKESKMGREKGSICRLLRHYIDAQCCLCYECMTSAESYFHRFSRAIEVFVFFYT